MHSTTEKVFKNSTQHGLNLIDFLSGEFMTWNDTGKGKRKIRNTKSQIKFIAGMFNERC